MRIILTEANDINQSAACPRRFVLGGYLAFVGVTLLSQMVRQKPPHMILMCALSVVFVIVGGGYAIYSLKKLLDIRKEERGTVVSDESEEDSGSAAVHLNAARQMNMQSTKIKKVQEDSTEKGSAEEAGGNENGSAGGEEPAASEERAAGKTPASKDDKESLAESDRGEEMKQETIEEEIENDYEEK